MHGRVGGSANLESMDVELVSGNYFSVLGVKPILGHGFTEAEDEPAGGHPVAMVSYSWWKRRLGRDPAIVGKAVTLESTVYTIIGVTRRSSSAPRSASLLPQRGAVSQEREPLPGRPASTKIVKLAAKHTTTNQLPEAI